MSRTQLLFDGARWRDAWLGLIDRLGAALLALHPPHDGPAPRDLLPLGWLEEELLHHPDARARLAGHPAMAGLVRRDPLLVALPPGWWDQMAAVPAPWEALELRAPVLFAKRVAAGTAVSYGETWRATRASRVATVGLGYGDGFRRDFSSRGVVRVRDVAVPVVGRVCMDQTLVDLTDHPAGGEVEAGEWVLALGGARGEAATSCDFLSAARRIDLPLAELVHGLAPRVERWQAGASTLRPANLGRAGGSDGWADEAGSPPLE